MPKAKSYSDLVHNAKLETELAEAYTEHIIHLPGNSASRRRVQRRERWVRDRTAPILGRGAYGIVYRETCDGRIRAVKEIRKQIAAEEELDYMRELEAIFKFSHPRYAHCFVRSDGWFDNRDSIYISMEFIENGDLQRYLTRPFCEIEAKQIISQIQEGLEFMHDNGFIHRDLKPGNIMVVEPRPNWFVKIADFGISKRRLQDTTTLLTQQRGTVAFCAPEVFGFVAGGESEGSCTVAVDMWSLGVVAFSILGNSIPFKNCGELSKYGLGIRELPLEILLKQGVSEDGRDFVQQLLLPSPEARLSTKDASQHSWLSSLRDLEPGDVDNINQFHSQFVTKSSVLPASEPSASWSTPDATVALPSRPISRQKSPKLSTQGSTQPLIPSEDLHRTNHISNPTQGLKYQSRGMFEDESHEAVYRDKDSQNQAISVTKVIKNLKLDDERSSARPSIYKEPRVDDCSEDCHDNSQEDKVNRSWKSWRSVLRYQTGYASLTESSSPKEDSDQISMASNQAVYSPDSEPEKDAETGLSSSIPLFVKSERTLKRWTDGSSSSSSSSSSPNENEKLHRKMIRRSVRGGENDFREALKANPALLDYPDDIKAAIGKHQSKTERKKLRKVVRDVKEGGGQEKTDGRSKVPRTLRESILFRSVTGWGG